MMNLIKNKIVLSISLLLFLSACSKMIFPDGVARVILKNGYPCVYLNNGKTIHHLTSGYYDETRQVGTHHQFKSEIEGGGSNRDKCLFFNNQYSQLKYKTPYWIEASYPDHVHKSHFCVVNTNGVVRLVQAATDETGKRFCTDLAWKPVKHYVGIFAEIERFWDWLFNLNGYTKEEF